MINKTKINPPKKDQFRTPIKPGEVEPRLTGFLEKFPKAKPLAKGLALGAGMLFLAFSVQSVDAAVVPRSANNLGLIGYWSMDEGTSTVAHDFSGNRFTATLTNTPLWTPGRHGKALLFATTSSQQVVLPDIDTNITTAVTISAWIKPTYAFPPGYRGIAGTTSGKLMMFLNNGRLYIDVATENGRVFVSSGQVITQNNTWYHVVLTYDGANEIGYVNGVNAISNAQTGTITQNTAARIGYSGFSSEYFDGVIDDVRIYNRALTQAEILTLYKTGTITKRQPNNNGLLASVTFDEGTSTIARDFSGNRHAFTPYPGLSGTNVSTTTMWVAGKHAGAMRFDGTDDYALLASTSAPNLQISGDYTISMWVKLITAPASGQFLTKSIQPSSVGIYFGYNIAGSGWVFGGDNSSNLPASTASADDIGKWHFITGVKVGTTRTLYVDGVLVGSSSVGNSSLDNNGNWSLGAGNTGANGTTPTRFSNSIMDDLRIYNRALSADEISSLYGAGTVTVNASQNTKYTNGLVGSWSFNGPDMTGKVYDRSGQGNDGYVYNTATSTAVTPGRVGQAIKFDGLNDYVGTGANINLGANIASVSFWMKTPATTTGGTNHGEALVEFSTNFNSNDAFVITTNDMTGAGGGSTPAGAVKVSMHSAGGYSIYYTDNNYSGAWHHVVAVMDRTQATAAAQTTIYVDGALAAKTLQGAFNTVHSTNFGSYPIFFGARSGGAAALEGTIDEVRLYNRVLSAAEVKQLYNLGR